eukprot:TRINITY_DN12151_c0_g1_i6.p1 TRINITY_DN12151_c0_g1~~TRINITY_DN12151_c0_g1_i6.p1  ORF type:complete len:1275 (+),score=409.23 TRINITY_DN12151_c0_g1_i6:307-4131(+)
MAVTGSAAQNQIKTIFYALDSDNSDSLDLDELDCVLKHLGMEDAAMRKQQLPLLMAELDSDNDGEVTLDEFLSGCSRIGMGAALATDGGDDTPTTSNHGSETGAQAAVLFDSIDDDSSGSIDRTEIEVMMKDLAGDMPEQELQVLVCRMMELLDDDGDGKVTRAEFVTAAARGQLDGLMALNSRQEQVFETGVRRESHLSLPAEKRLLLAQRLEERTPPARTEETKHIEDEQYMHLWQMFNVADEDGSGQIELFELVDLLSDTSLVGADVARLMTADRVEHVMNMIDDDESGSLEFHEFCLAFDQVLHKNGTPAGVLGALATALAVDVYQTKHELTMLKSMFTKERQDTKQLKDDLVTRYRHEQEQQQSTIDELSSLLRGLEDKASAKDARIAQLERTNREQEEEIANLLKMRDARPSQASAGGHLDLDLQHNEEIQELRQALSSQAEHHEEDLHRYIIQLAIAEVQLRAHTDTMILYDELKEAHQHGFLALLSEEEQAQVVAAHKAKQASHAKLSTVSVAEEDNGREDAIRELEVELKQRDAELALAVFSGSQLEALLSKAQDDHKNTQSKFQAEAATLAAKLETCKKSSKATIDGLKDQLADLEVQLKAMEGQVATENEITSQLRAQLQEERASAQAKESTLQQQVTTLQHDNAELKIQLETMRSSAEERATMAATELEQELARLHADLEQVRNHVQQEQERLLSETAAHDRTREALEAALERQNQLKSQLEEVSSASEKLQADAANEARVHADKVNMLQQNLKEQQRKAVKAFQDTIASLTLDNQQARDELTKATSLIEQQQQAILTLEEQLRKQDKSQIKANLIVKEQQQRDEMREVAKDKELAEAHDQKHALEMQIGELEANIASLKENLAKAQSENALLIEECDQLKPSNHADREASNASTGAHVQDQLESQQSAHDAAVQALQTQLDTLQRQLDTAHKGKSDLQTGLEAALARVEQLELDVTTARNELEEATARHLQELQRCQMGNRRGSCDMLDVEGQMDKVVHAVASASERMHILAEEVKTKPNAQWHEAIVDLCVQLLDLVEGLTQAAAALQHEIVEEQTKTSEVAVKEFYKQNGAWVEGLITGAKAVAQDASRLVETADRAMHGDALLEEIIVCGQEIAASTAQLVSASRVKARLESSKKAKLETISAQVRKTTKSLIKIVREACEKQAQKSMPDYSTLSLIKAKRLQMDAQVGMRSLSTRLLLQSSHCMIGSCAATRKRADTRAGAIKTHSKGSLRQRKCAWGEASRIHSESAALISYLMHM